MTEEPCRGADRDEAGTDLGASRPAPAEAALAETASRVSGIRVRLPAASWEREVVRLLDLYFPGVPRSFAEAGAAGGEARAAGGAIGALAEAAAVGEQAGGRSNAPLDSSGSAVLRISLRAREIRGRTRITADIRQAGRGVARSRSVPAASAVDGGAPSDREAKRAGRAALYEALRDFTGKGQPWGALTGVRPVKLVHAFWRAHPEHRTPDRDGRLAGRLSAAFGIEPARARLLVEVARREREAIPDLAGLRDEVSIYVGVPFCPTHCAYCTFPAYSMVEKARYAPDFLDALTREAEWAGGILEEYGVPVTTVYVGGGTPTSLKAPELRTLLSALRDLLPGAGRWREFCVEAGRADTITPDRVDVMRDLGVTRVSVNPQTWTASTLKRIGRGHSPDIVAKRFRLFRDAGFDNINMDLILGLPGEGLADAAHSLEQTLSLEPDSITVHTLSYKRGSAVGQDRGAYNIPDDPTVRGMMRMADAQVRADGYTPYYLYRQKDILANLENVGYARPGKEGLYNILIMEEAQTIVGLGGGAASKWVDPGTGRIAQHHNPAEPRVYVHTAEEVQSRKEKRLRAVCESIRARR